MAKKSANTPDEELVEWVGPGVFDDQAEDGSDFVH